jgi:hypothetical protein
MFPLFHMGSVATNPPHLYLSFHSSQPSSVSITSSV